MQIALAAHQPLSELVDAEDAVIATWIELLNEQAEQARHR